MYVYMYISAPQNATQECPTKKILYWELRKNPNSHSHIPPSSRVFCPAILWLKYNIQNLFKTYEWVMSHIWMSHVATLFRCYSRHFNHNMAGKKPRSSCEEYGSPSLDFYGAPGANFFCGALLRGCLRGWAPQALAPQKAPQNEPSL